jgi:hypothetical protein
MLQKVVSVEKARGCGYRSSGKNGVGIYLMGGLYNEHCERLPFPLTVCPCCGAGIKPARSWTWVDPRLLFSEEQEPRCQTLSKADGAHGHNCSMCPLCNAKGYFNESERSGLLWVGEKFYPTPEHFLKEAVNMSVSRKIASVPHGFETGKTWVFLAHIRGCQNENEKPSPAIIHAFRPGKVDLVVDDLDKPPDRALNLAKTLGEENCRLVKVVKAEEREVIEAEGDEGELRQDELQPTESVPVAVV